MITAAELAAAVRRVLRDELQVDVAALRPDAPLFTTGLLDSAGLVQLATAVEALAGIAIADRDVTPDHFDSLESIAAYLRRRGALAD